MKYRYIIIDEDCTPFAGTNDTELATKVSEFFVVVDAKEGMQLPWPDDIRTPEERILKEYIE